jgi:DegV family protein with EDD domain
MMIRIVTDSTADLSPELIAEHGIEVNPLNIILDGKAHLDGIDITKDQFYEWMERTKEIPSTSQPSPATLRDVFQSILDRGEDVFYVGLSSAFSGTFQSARIARDMLDEPERVTLHDSMSVSYGQGLQAVYAAQLVKQGKTSAEITAALTDIRPRVRIVFSVDHLNNLRKSGRINNLSFLFGSLLNIKPILMIDEESVVQVYERARGKKNAWQSLHRFIDEHPQDPAFPLGVGHIYCPAKGLEMADELKAKGHGESFLFEISGVIGVHAGTGTIGLIYVSTN